jgi:hypothetical protein
MLRFIGAGDAGSFDGHLFLIDSVIPVAEGDNVDRGPFPARAARLRAGRDEVKICRMPSYVAEALTSALARFERFLQTQIASTEVSDDEAVMLCNDIGDIHSVSLRREATIIAHSAAVSSDIQSPHRKLERAANGLYDGKT